LNQEQNGGGRNQIMQNKNVKKLVQRILNKNTILQLSPKLKTKGYQEMRILNFIIYFNLKVTKKHDY
jgi:predicted phosphatase